MTIKRIKDLNHCPPVNYCPPPNCNPCNNCPCNNCPPLNCNPCANYPCNPCDNYPPQNCNPCNPCGVQPPHYQQLTYNSYSQYKCRDDSSCKNDYSCKNNSSWKNDSSDSSNDFSESNTDYSDKCKCKDKCKCEKKCKDKNKCKDKCKCKNKCKCKDKCKCKNESIKRKCGECNNINCKCIKYYNSYETDCGCVAVCIYRDPNDNKIIVRNIGTENIYNLSIFISNKGCKPYNVFLRPYCCFPIELDIDNSKCDIYISAYVQVDKCKYVYSNTVCINQ